MLRSAWLIEGDSTASVYDRIVRVQSVADGLIILPFGDDRDDPLPV